MNEKDYKELLQHPKRLSPIRAIRLKCWDCCGGSDEEIYKWPYRTGKNPYLKPMSAERRAELSLRMKENHSKARQGLD